MARNIERDVRVLQVYAVVVTLAAAALFVTGYRLPGQKLRLGEVDVERLNLVEKAGWSW